jgi:hypothetical protein
MDTLYHDSTGGICEDLLWTDSFPLAIRVEIGDDTITVAAFPNGGLGAYFAGEGATDGCAIASNIENGAAIWGMATGGTATVRSA